MTHSKVHVPKGNMPDPPKGTHWEFASTKLASGSKSKKGKAIKCSITGLGKPMTTASKLPHVPKTSPCVSTEAAKEHKSLTKSPVHIPAVPVLWLLPPITHVTNATPPVNLVDTPATTTPNSSDIAGSLAVTPTAAAIACTSLVNKPPTSQAGTPQILSWPGLALSQDHPHSVHMMHPPSHAAMPLISTALPIGNAGPVALMKHMSQPHWLESETASPELLTNSSQETSSLPEQTNVNSQVSDSSDIHRMTLKYSEWWGRYWWGVERVKFANSCSTVYDAARHSKQNHPASISATHSYFTRTSTRGWQIHPRWTKHQVKPGSSKAVGPTTWWKSRIQTADPLFAGFFGTHWYLVCKDTFELYAIYDTWDSI